MTKTQTKQVETLKAALVIGKRCGECIHTGLPTNSLRALRDAGLIECSQIYLRGYASADIRVRSAS